MITLIHIIATVGSIAALATLAWHPKPMAKHHRYWKKLDKKDKS